MAAISGISGSVTFAGGFDTNPHSWTINTTAEWLPTTVFGAAYETGLTGVKKWSGSFVCYADDTDALPLAGTTGAATFVAAAGRQYTGTIHTTGVDVGISEEGDSREITITFQGDDTLGAA